MKRRLFNRGCKLAEGLFAAILTVSCSQPARQMQETGPSRAPQSVALPHPALLVPAPLADEHMVIVGQRALIQLGYNVGSIDGVMGPATHQAILAFQKDRGLAQDGQLTPALATLLNNLVAQLPKINTTTVMAGDVLLYGDGSKEVAKSSHIVSWDLAGDNGLVAIRPSTAGWPQAARAGLDWAISHALDVAGGPSIAWSSTGVERQFEILATPILSARETALAGDSALSCRHFELRDSQHRYPALVCRDQFGEWYFLRSRIRLAHPARTLGSQAHTESIRAK